MAKGSSKSGYTIKDFRGPSLPPGAVGSFEHSNRPYYPNVYEESRSQAMRVLGPSISFHTDVPPMRAFIWTLKALERAGFHWIWRYKGPTLGMVIGEGEHPSIDSVLAALRDEDDSHGAVKKVKARVLHKEKGVVARVIVGKARSTKVKVKVKGAILKTQWTTFQRSMHKKFKSESSL